MALTDMTPRQIAAEFLATYRQHQIVVASYAEGTCGADVLQSSAHRLRELRAAYRVASECP